MKTELFKAIDTNFPLSSQSLQKMMAYKFHLEQMINAAEKAIAHESLHPIKVAMQEMLFMESKMTGLIKDVENGKFNHTDSAASQSQ